MILLSLDITHENCFASFAPLREIIISYNYSLSVRDLRIINKGSVEG